MSGTLWWMYSCQGDGWSVHESRSLRFPIFLFQSYGPRWLYSVSILCYIFVSYGYYTEKAACVCGCVALSDGKVGDGGCI